MNRAKWIWGAIIILLIISLPGLWDRWQAEKADHTYEVILPFDEIEEASNEAGDDIDTVLAHLKSAGLNTVSVQPVTLKQLEGQGKLALYNDSQLESILRFTGGETDFESLNKGIYIAIDDASPYKDMIQNRFDLDTLNINDQTLLFIPDDSNVKLSSSLGYDNEVIDALTEHGLRYTLRFRNEDVKDNPDATSFIVEQAKDLAGKNSNSIIFSGTEVAGYPEPDQIKAYSSKLLDAGFRFYSIEFTDQKGFQTIAANSHYQTMRLLSMGLVSEKMPANIDKAIRAVKERSTDGIFFHIPAEDGEEALDMATTFLTSLDEQMPGTYTAGMPSPHDPVAAPVWVQLSVILASVLLVYLAVSKVLTHRWGLTAAAGIAAFGIGFIILERDIFAQAIALAVAVSAPVYAVVANQKGSRKLSVIALQYAKAIGVSTAAILIVTGLLNGNQYLSGITLFRGVKLVYIVPIVVVALVVLWKYIRALFAPGKLVAALNAPIKNWHVLVVVLVGAIVFYYVARGGNQASVSDLELIMRQQLEDWLYVRPRTKEILIGFPLYTLALYILGRGAKWGKLLLIPGVIGFLSIVNTFSHFHIPLDISILRTVYGVILGFAVGLIYIYVFKLGARIIQDKFKTRWS